MAYKRITWLPDVLRAAGIEVVLHPGWKTRGLSAAQSFDPVAVVWHHDASARGDSPGVPGSMIARFPTAAAQCWVDRAGRWHIIASGRAPHAGAVLPGMPGNHNSIGVETDHTSGEDWPPALIGSLRAGTAAILEHLHRSPATGLHFHKTICAPPGRKVDPAGLTLTDERARVKSLIDGPRDTRPAVSLTRVKRAATVSWWSGVVLTAAARRDRDRVRKALAAERCKTYRDWQKRLGYRGADADGVPGLSSLRTLGNRQGFRVTH